MLDYGIGPLGTNLSGIWNKEIIEENEFEDIGKWRPLCPVRSGLIAPIGFNIHTINSIC